jgi:hypothetical protein
MCRSLLACRLLACCPNASSMIDSTHKFTSTSIQHSSSDENMPRTKSRNLSGTKGLSGPHHSKIMSQIILNRIGGMMYPKGWNEFHLLGGLGFWSL